MKISIIYTFIAISFLILSGCLTQPGPKLLSADQNSLTVLHQGQRVKLRRDGAPPEKFKGMTQHGIFVYSGDGSNSVAGDILEKSEPSSGTSPEVPQ